MKIVPGDLDDPEVLDLLRSHVSAARAATAPGSAHALDASRLKTPGIWFFAAWDDGTLLGIGAMKELSPSHGEVKSMHTAATRRRQGVGRALLAHIASAARSRGMTRLSLETGSWAYFEPARAFYRSAGFRECPPFGDYAEDPNSVFMTLELG